MANATPTPTPRPNGRKLGAIVPQLPIVKAKSLPGRRLYISHLDTFTGRFGLSWRVRCVDEETGEVFMTLMAANAVRDDVFGAMVVDLAKNGGNIGPLVVIERDLPDGNSTWEFQDAE